MLSVGALTGALAFSAVGAAKADIVGDIGWAGPGTFDATTITFTGFTGLTGVTGAYTVFPVPCPACIAVLPAGPQTYTGTSLDGVQLLSLTNGAINATITIASYTSSITNGLLGFTGTANLTLTGQAPTLGTFELSSNGSHGFFNFSTTVHGVPGPIVGAGLPGLVLGCGALLALVRRRRREKFA